MRIEPAHIDQIRRAKDGRFVTIDADVGGVVADIQRLDKTLRVRFAEAGRPPYYVVYRVHRNGDPCADDDPERTEELVLTAQDLDHRVVKRLQYINPEGRSDYDFAKAVEKQSKARGDIRLRRFREKIAEHAGEAQHALRKDLGQKPSIFVP